jgi:hypothetical protein
MSIAEGMTVSRADADAAPGRFPVNIRITVPLLPQPFFLTLIIGRERRGAARRVAERRRHPVSTWGNVAAFVLVSTLCGIGLLFTAFIAVAL